MMRAAYVPLALLSTALLAQTGPSFHWPLDEFTGAVAYDIVGGSNGQLQNGLVFSPAGGYFGGACSFDGADDRIDLGPCDITTGTGGFSISLWMRPGLMTGAEQMLMAKTTGPLASDYTWSLSQINSTAIRFRLQTQGVVSVLTTSGSSLFSGSWYHIAASYDGAQLRIHINAALMAASPATGLLPFAPMSPATLGDRLDGTASYLGHIDDVRLYDHGLSDAEILDIVLSNVATGIGETQVIAIAGNGEIRLPATGWNEVRIINAQGRVIKERSGAEGTLSLRDEPAGLYLVCLRGERGEQVHPLMKP